MRGRHYGGGVLELVPSEIEKLLLPIPGKIRPDLVRLDAMVRKSSAADVLERQNEAVLGTLGLSKTQQWDLLSAWLRLKNRRQRISEEDGINQSQS